MTGQENSESLQWDYDGTIHLDSSVVFGKGYDFSGLEHLRQSATSAGVVYVMWPSNGKWSLYRDSDGMLAFERFASEAECKAAAEDWRKET